MRALVVFGLVLGVSSSSSAAPIERRLHVSQAEASSFDKNDYNRFEENYLPLYVGDDDPTTAWTEGAPGDGVGQWLRVRFSSMKGATKVRLRIRNGYQKSHKLFLANERAKKVTFKLLPGNTTIEQELKDAEGWQEVVLEQPSGVLAGVEMTIGEVYKGTKYEDLCISDVQIFATAETPDNPAFEKTVFERVKKWKGDRVNAAKTFAQASKDRPIPMASGYEVKPDKDSKDWSRNDDAFGGLVQIDAKTLTPPEQAAVSAAQAWIKKGNAVFEAVSLSTSSQPKLPTVDGMCTPQLGTCAMDFCDAPMTPFDALPLLTNDSFKVIEAKDRPTFASALDQTAAKKYKGCHSTDGATLAWAVREGDDRRTRALVVLGCGLVEGREGRYVGSSLQLLTYDEQGRLRLTANPFGATTFTWKGEGATATIKGGTFVTLGSSGTFSAISTVAKAPTK